MIRKIRDARVDFRTGVIIIALALLVWGVVTYVRVRDLVPEEFAEPAGPPAP
jgi:uncharacterized membrane protein